MWRNISKDSEGTEGVDLDRERNCNTPPLIGLNEGLCQVGEYVGFAYSSIREVSENTFIEKYLARLIAIARKANMLARDVTLRLFVTILDDECIQSYNNTKRPLATVEVSIMQSL